MEKIKEDEDSIGLKDVYKNRILNLLMIILIKKTYIFQEENRQEKLKSIINNIDNKLDEIIVYLYTGQIPIVHSEQE